MVDARHELRLSSRLMQRLRALVRDLPWTTGNLHMEEAIHIPNVERRLNNEFLLLQVCGLLLKHQGPMLVSNPPPGLQKLPCRLYCFLMAMTRAVEATTMSRLPSWIWQVSFLIVLRECLLPPPS